MKTTEHQDVRKKSLQEYIDIFSNTRVLVIGDIILDKYVWGDVSRISPEAPVPVVEVRQETRALGGAANVIHNIATLGAEPILCGVIGKDAIGREVLKKVDEMGLITEGIIVEQDRPTTIKTRIIAHSQQMVRFDRESLTDIMPGSMERLLGFIEKRIDNIDAVVVSDYGKGVVSASVMKHLMEMIRSVSGKKVVVAVDPKTDNFKYYQGVDTITPNHHEAGIFCRFDIVDKKTMHRAGRQILRDLNCRSVLITQGRDGMTLFEHGGEITHIPTVAKKVFDVTGAGDTVIGTLSLGLASGMELKTAAKMSNFAAGIVVGEVGTSAVKAEDLKKAVNEHPF